MIPLQTLKDRLGITGAEFDVDLAEMEESAVAWIENRTDRYFGPQKQIVVHTGQGDVKWEPWRGIGYWPPNGRKMIYLVERPRIPDGESAPVTDHITVIEQRCWPGDADEVTIDSDADDGYIVIDDVREQSYLQRKGGERWRRDREYVVTYTGGYPWNDEPSNDLAAPADIRQAVIKLVSVWFQSRKGMLIGPLTGSIGNYSFDYASISADQRREYDEVLSTVKLWEQTQRFFG